MTKFFNIFLLAFVLPTVLGKCNEDKAKESFKRSIYDFSVALTTRIAVEKDLHFVTSPLSVWSILSAVSRGAAGKTLEEIQEVLHHHKINKCINNKYYSIVRKIVEKKSDVTVERGGAIVIDKYIIVKRPFLNNIKRNGITKALVLPFDDLEEVAGKINTFVRNATHGIIDEIVEGEDLTDKRLLLLDTIYFKGNWKVPFLPSDTELTPFYDESKNHIGDVNLMFVNDKFNYVYMEEIRAQVLELPYGNGRFSMLIFLPFEGTGLMTVVDKLKYFSLRSIYSLFENRTIDSVAVKLPRFKIETELDSLEDLLKDMGMESVFDKTADFREISNHPLFVSGLRQKASIEVTEEGTEAVAVTEFDFEDRILPSSVTIQRPFMFMIVEKLSEVVLFTGAYSNPSLF